MLVFIHRIQKHKLHGWLVLFANNMHTGVTAVKCHIRVSGHPVISLDTWSVS